MKVNNKSLTSQCREIILQMINNKEFEHKLPSEQEFATKLGVSRNTVREALKSLISEGILTSKHGVGTFILKSPRNLTHNLTTLESTTKIIEMQGYSPGTKSVIYDRCVPSSNIIQKFNNVDLKEILYIERVRTADTEPVVFVEDYIPYCEGMFERFSLLPTTPLFEFLGEFNKTVAFSDCSIQAVISDTRLMKKLSLSTPQGLLLLKQLHYSSAGIPIFYSDSYFITDKIEFGLIRRCIE